VDGNRRISMHISVASSESAVAAAIEHLYSVSDPASRDYGKHWNAARVESHFAATSDAIEEIIAWLSQSGIPRSSLRVSRDRTHIFFNPKVREAELLLNANYYEYHDKTLPSDEPQLAVEAFSIPDSITANINFIEPTFPTNLGGMKQTWRAKVEDEEESLAKRFTANNGTKVNCLKYMTPECLRLLYNFPHNDIQPHPNNSFGVYQVSWQTWLPNDLDIFFSRFEPQLVGKRPAVLPINGGYMQYNHTGFSFNAEPALDFEYALSLVQPQPVINIQVGDYFTAGGLNNMLAAFDGSYCDSLDPRFDNIYPVWHILSICPFFQSI
jgi:tripeptidyl-peptidase I